jgi:hypothetical protein
LELAPGNPRCMLHLSLAVKRYRTRSVVLPLNSPFHFFANSSLNARPRNILSVSTNSSMLMFEQLKLPCASVIVINNKVFDAGCMLPCPLFPSCAPTDTTSQLMLWIELQLKQFAQPNKHIFVTARPGSIRRPMPSPNSRRMDV